MNNLVEVTTENLRKRVARGAENAELAYQRLIKESGISEDLIVPVGQEGFRGMGFTANGSVKAEIKGSEYHLHDNAIGQLGERFGVPAGYLKNLANSHGQWGRDLCAHILSEQTANSGRQRVLVRSVGEEIRGVMSDRYRRLNSVDLVESFVKASYSKGAVMADGLMTDTRIFIETVLPQPITFETPKNGLVTMGYGAQLRTSDYGHGALELRTFTIMGVCLNGMVRNSVMKTVHLGSRLPDNMTMSERTYRLDTQTQVSAISDLSNQIFNPVAIQREMEVIQNASAMEIDLDKEIKRLPQLGMSKGEAERVTSVLAQGRESDGVMGEPSLWKLVNGVTAVARDLESKDRERELQEIAGKLMSRAESLK